MYVDFTRLLGSALGRQLELLSEFKTLNLRHSERFPNNLGFVKLLQ